MPGNGNTAPKTAVLFRKWPESEGGGVIALFPYQAGTTSDLAACESFEHAGQHGAADLAGVMELTGPATPDEYAALYAELTGAPYGYRLEVRVHIPGDAHIVRRSQLRPAP